ncbi:nose resistant to fluoxetine protein 6 [Tetranychus urticae]|uniref:Nose resistant-to-fluoxetine protein N-terminal domain-containing protein n=1 Tax=Tetranychus urticae TaxID=32264 RepID=T1K6S4_TETUR|nr:nose resistant to fluoxetine protein 6 [Tetranychus urticae]
MQLCTSFTLLLILCANIIGRVHSEGPTSHSVNVNLIDRQIHLVTSGFSSVFWNYIRSSNGSLDSVSSQCSSHLSKLIESSLKGHPLAFKFLSLSGSRPNNFLDATYAAFGSYDSCLAISPFHEDKDDQTIKGKYCLTSLEPDLHRNGQSNGQILSQLYPHHFDAEFNFTIKVGFCVPSVCSQNDVQQIITQAFTEYSWKLVDVHSCEVETNFFDRLKSANKGQQFFLWLLVTLVCVVMMATYMDLKGRSTVDERSSLFWVQQFSAKKSVKSLFRKPDAGSRITILDSLRLTTLIIVVVSHATMWYTVISSTFLVEDNQYVLDLLSKFYLQPVVNDWITEGLFFLGGVGSAITLLRKMKPETPATQYLNVIIRRAALLIPLLIPAIALEVILPLVGSGPIYQSINQYRSNVCLKNFWMNLLHIQNYRSGLEMCALATWSIAVEWQLFVFACILIYIYKRNNRLGLTLNILTILFGLYRVIVIFSKHDALPHPVMIGKHFRDILDRGNYYYIATDAHIWSYFLAILFVVMMAGNYEAKIKETLPRYNIWVYSLLVMLLYSSSLWNTFGMKIEPITTLICVCFSKFVVGSWCMSVFMSHGRKIRRFLAQSKSVDMYIHPEEPNSQLFASKDEIAASNNNLELMTKTEMNNRKERSRLRKLHRFEIVLRIFKPAYFVHTTVYAWYFTSLRSTIAPSLLNYISFTTSLVTLALFCGFFFHILILGPIERINYISSKKKTKAKMHSS